MTQRSATNVLNHVITSRAGSHLGWPGTSRGKERRRWREPGMSLIHLFVGCRFLSSSAAAQLQAGGGERDREQLQSSCQPYQSATNGTAYSVGTGTPHTKTHTTHTHTQTQPRLVARISAGSISPFSCGDFAVITSAVLKRIPRSSKAGGNCTTSGLMRAFQKPF